MKMQLPESLVDLTDLLESVYRLLIEESASAYGVYPWDPPDCTLRQAVIIYATFHLFL